MSFAKFSPFNLSITYNLEKYFLDEDLIRGDENYINIYLKYLLEYIKTNQLNPSLLDYLNSLSTYKKNKLVNQLSSIVHEKKHFHDYLLSSIGNYTIRRYFYLYSYTFAMIFESKNDKCKELFTPINRMVQFNEDISDNLKFFIEKKNLAFESINTINTTFNVDRYGEFSDEHIAKKIKGYEVFEAGAVLSQFSLVEELFNIDYALGEFQANYYRKEFSHYANLISRVQYLLSSITSNNQEFILHNNSTLNVILFISLNGFTENEKYTNNIAEPAPRLISILGLLKQENCDVNSYTDIELFNYIEDLLEKNEMISAKSSLLENIEINKKHYSLVKEIIDRNYPNGNSFTGELLKAYASFIDLNNKMTREFIDNPISYLSPQNYINDFQNKFPTQNIIECDSGSFFNVFFLYKVINFDEIKPILFDEKDKKLWSIKLNPEENENIANLSSLYLFYAPLFFTLVEGEKAKFNLINPKLYDETLMRMKEQINIKEAYPIDKEKLFRERMNEFWNHNKKNIVKCNLCCSDISKPNGFLISGDEILKEVKFDKFTSKNILFYKGNYSMFCVCNQCYSK